MKGFKFPKIHEIYTRSTLVLFPDFRNRSTIQRRKLQAFLIPCGILFQLLFLAHLADSVNLYGVVHIVAPCVGIAITIRDHTSVECGNLNRLLFYYLAQNYSKNCKISQGRILKNLLKYFKFAKKTNNILSLIGFFINRQLHLSLNYRFICKEILAKGPI